MTQASSPSTKTLRMSLRTMIGMSRWNPATNASTPRTVLSPSVNSTSGSSIAGKASSRCSPTALTYEVTRSWISLATCNPPQLRGSGHVSVCMGHQLTPAAPSGRWARHGYRHPPAQGRAHLRGEGLARRDEALGRLRGQLHDQVVAIQKGEEPALGVQAVSAEHPATAHPGAAELLSRQLVEDLPGSLAFLGHSSALLASGLKVQVSAPGSVPCAASRSRPR